MNAASFAAVVAKHPYLFGNVFTLAIVALVLLVVPRRRRRFALWSAAACVPGVLVALAESTYWRPAYILPGKLRIEDVLFNYVAGALVGLLVVLPWPAGGPPPRHPWLRRYLPAAGAGLLLFVVFVQLEIPVFEASLWATGLWGAGLLALRPRWAVRATMAGSAFVVAYWAVVRVELLMWPEFIRQWGAAHSLTFLWLGVPAGELVWAAVFGISWAAFMLFVLEPPAVGVRPAGASSGVAADHSASSSRK